MQRPTSKLTFQKKTFRVLDPRELARIKGGNGEEPIEPDGNMVLGGELVPDVTK